MQPPIYVTYYATKNRLSPLVKMIGHWPASSGLARSCARGVKILCRPATPQEREIEAASPRHMAYRWRTIEGMLAMEDEEQGQAGLMLREAVSAKRPEIDAVLAESARSEQRFQRRRAKRRDAAPGGQAEPENREPQQRMLFEEEDQGRGV